MDDVARVLHAWSVRPNRGVIFDFNGTLSDDEPVLLKVFTALFAECVGWRMAREEYTSRLVGLGDREIVERVVAERSDGDASLVELMLELRHRRYIDLVQAESPIRPDTCALVSRLAAADVPMAIVTGAQRSDVEFVLERSEAGRHLQLIITDEDVTRGKPDPEGFCRGAELLAVDPAAVLVFEDSVAGVHAAHAAGMMAIGVEGTVASPVLAAAADAVVPALRAQLLDVLSDQVNGTGCRCAV